MSSPAREVDSNVKRSAEPSIEVLYIDDEPDFFNLFKNGIGGSNDVINVETTTGGRSGLEIITEKPPDCVVADYDMPDMDGLELLTTVRENHPNLPFILYTGQGNETVASQAMTAGATDYLSKDTGAEHYAHLSCLIRTAVEKHREEQLATRKQELIRRTEVASDAGGFELDVENEITLVTDGVRQIFNLSEETNISRDQLVNLFDADDQNEVQHTIERVLATDEDIYKTFSNHHSDGEERLLQITFRPKSSEDTTTVVQGIIRDITQEREQKQQIEVFDRVLRHNIRNNLNLIRGAAEMIESESTQDIADYSKQIIEESDRLLDAATKQRDIMNILREEPEYESLRIEPVLQQITSDVAGKYPQAELTVECPSDLSVRASSRLQQALEELVTNAIVHNDIQPPEVKIVAAKNENAITIDIIDNGPQIPEMERDVLVELQERTPLYHGSGLGLWLVKLIVSRSNGQIVFAQNSPTGNVISIEFPSIN